MGVGDGDRVAAPPSFQQDPSGSGMPRAGVGRAERAPSEPLISKEAKP